MKKFLVFLSAIVMVFGMTFTVSAQPPGPPGTELANMSWHPHEGGIIFDEMSRAHSWKYVLADLFPEYAHGWKALVVGVGVHISDGCTPGNFKICINDEFEAVLEIVEDPYYGPARPPAHLIGDYILPPEFGCIQTYSDVPRESVNGGEVEVTIEILQNDDGTWPAFQIYDLGVRAFMKPTIVIDGCDTRVFDVEYDGQLISALIDQCALDAENHYQFMACIWQLTRELVQEDIITRPERRAIIRCAARSCMP